MPPSCPYGPAKHTQRETTALKFLSKLFLCPTTILTNLKWNMIPPWGQCQDYKLHKIIMFWQSSSQWNSFSRQEGCISSNKLFNKWGLKTLWSPTKYFLILHFLKYWKISRNNSLSRQKTTMKNCQIKRGKLFLISIKLSLKSRIFWIEGGWAGWGIAHPVLGCQNYRKSHSCFSACPSRFEFLPTPKDLQMIFIRGQLSLYTISRCYNLFLFLFKLLSM